MNGAETQNPHRQLGARSHCEQLAVELKWIVEAGWSLGIPSTAHWRCLVVGRHLKYSPWNECTLNSNTLDY